MLTAKQMMNVIDTELSIRRDLATGKFYDYPVSIQQGLHRIMSAIRILKKRQDDKAIRYFNECAELIKSESDAIERHEAMIKNIRRVYSW